MLVTTKNGTPKIFLSQLHVILQKSIFSYLFVYLVHRFQHSISNAFFSSFLFQVCNLFKFISQFTTKNGTPKNQFVTTSRNRPKNNLFLQEKRALKTRKSTYLKKQKTKKPQNQKELHKGKTIQKNIWGRMISLHIRLDHLKVLYLKALNSSQLLIHAILI